MDEKQKRLIIIDGTALVYRAFHAIPATLSTSTGLQTNAVYGFTQSITKIIRDYSPDYLAVCFDVRGPTFRHEEFEAYKAERPPMPDMLSAQLPYIKKVLSALRVSVLERETFEADDLIATLAAKAVREAPGVKVCIISGDKDLFQLVDRGAVVLDYLTGKEYGPEDVREKFGVPPLLLRDMLALAGDSSDNIPGVKGIGIKTAVKLISEYGSLDDIYEHIDEIKAPRLRERLAAGRDLAFMSRSLATLDASVELDLDIEDLRYPGPDYKRLAEVLKELEFGRMLREVLSREGAEESAGNEEEGEFATLGGSAALKEAMEKLFKSGAASVALLLGDGSGPGLEEIVAVALASGPRKAWYLPLYDNEKRALDWALEGFKEILSSKEIRKHTDSSKALFRHALTHGFRAVSVGVDTSIAAYLLNPSKTDYRVETLAFETLGVMAKGQESKDFDYVDLCKKSCNINMLAEEYERMLNENGLDGLYADMELPVSEVLAAMETAGIGVDAGLLRDFSKELETKLAEIRTSIFSAAGGEFNINSPKQLAEVLFTRLGLKPVKRTKTGFSTNEVVLRKLAPQHEVPAMVLSFRELSKLKSTYVDGLLELINPSTGRIHTTFNQTVTATGRLSSSKPNLQNIPQKGAYAGRIREAFVAKEGFTLLSGDYSQIELRIVAHLSGDPALVAAFTEGEDVHNRTARELFGYGSTEEVPAEMRRRAKAINFGIIYGMGPYGLAAELGISIDEAREYIDNYFLHYSKVKEFIDRTIEEAEERGYTLTIFGRRRFVPELRSPVEQVRAAGRRMAINTPVQGSSADIIKAAMVRLYRAMGKAGFESRLILQIHDELLVETRLDELEAISALLRREMEGVVELSVPLVVNLKHGRNWNEAMPI